nr:ORF1 [Anelloviridae sp.]
MPYFYRRPWNSYYYRRRRTFRRRRPRPPFRRRRFRRRVRRYNYKQKLKRLILREWQPKTIRKLTIKGLICLLQCNHNRIPFNYVMYENSTVPAHISGGGGFSIIQFSLENLYEQHEYLRNYWTTGNINTPLIRYHGCTLKLYKSKHIDYLLRPQNYYPMTSQQLTYTSMQPNMLMMLKGTIKVPSKQTTNSKKSFKKIRLPPPSLFQNKWYFQKDIAKTPLLLLQTSATTLDSYYIAPTSENNNITIKTLNTKLIENTYWNKDYSKTTNGYSFQTQGTISKFLWAAVSDTPNAQLKANELIYLGLTKTFIRGEAKVEIHSTAVTWERYTQDSTYWGNMFYPEYLQGDLRIFQSTMSWSEFKTFTSTNKENTLVGTKITEIVNPLIITLRYNPNTDSGIHNNFYLLSNSIARSQYDPPENLNLQLDGFPLWTTVYGFTDYIKKLQITQRTDNDYFLTISTDTTRPIWEKLLILDNDFIEGKSPGQSKPDAWDADRWYPQLQYQTNSMNNIALTGPGAPKLIGLKSEEVKIQYTFKFKLGGNPPPMAEIHNPIQQATFPIPSNMQRTNSLQSPTTPVELYLQSFDQRRDQLTKTAIHRISKDYRTEKTLVKTPTGPTMDVPATIQTQQTSDEETSEEEEKETSLFNQLLNQRAKQQRLKQRILLTLQQIQNLE